MSNNKVMPVMPSLTVPLNEESDETLTQVLPVMEKPKYEQQTTNIHNKILDTPMPKDGIDVVALRKGFYNNCRINENDKFKISTKEDFATWFKCSDANLEKVRVAFLKEKKIKTEKK